MTYIWRGKQYIVLAATNRTEGAELVALTLPTSFRNFSTRSSHEVRHWNASQIGDLCRSKAMKMFEVISRKTAHIAPRMARCCPYRRAVPK